MREESIECEELYYCGDIYSYDGIWYHSKFPEEWATSHKSETGPNECMNCLDYGCVKGVFIGYCANCALYVYFGSRGRGFESVGVECEDEEASYYPSAFDGYLKGVNINDIYPAPDYETDEELEEVVIGAEGEIEGEIEGEDVEYDVEDYLNGDPYADIYNTLEPNVFVCDYEGGYSDF